MNFNNACFEKAYGTFSQLEESSTPEFCFSGRSNVGKSSLINKLVNRKNLARVGGKPGKTITVNKNGRFLINTEADGPTVKNGKVVVKDGNQFIYTKENNYNAKANLVDVDVTIDSSNSGSLFAHNYGNIYATCSNCTFTYTDATTDSKIYRIASDNATFNSCTFNLNSRKSILAKKDRSIIFNNCTINDASVLFYSDSALASGNVIRVNTLKFVAPSIRAAS